VLTLDSNLMEDLAFTGGEGLEVMSVAHNRIEKIGMIIG
jgi:hypothetical protein